MESGQEIYEDVHYGRYGYSEQLKTCIKFSYFGNGGNFNNFVTFKECIKYCKKL